jgi:cytochrome c oxidase cbb3-type subunit 1
MHPFYIIRATGGLLFVIGSLLMVWNLWKTVRGDEPVDMRDQPRIAAAPELRESPAAARPAPAE